MNLKTLATNPAEIPMTPTLINDWTIQQTPLPGDLFGDICWPTKTITIDPRLPAAARRSTLAHEIEHARRGPAPDDPVLAAREELAVEKAAARRLIDIHALADAMIESDDLAYVADALDVDMALLRTRLENLHPSEVAYLRTARQAATL